MKSLESILNTFEKDAKKLVAVGAIAFTPFIYGCAVNTTVLNDSNVAAKVQQEQHYTAQDFSEKFNTVIGSTFTAKELDTYGACFDEIKSKIDWTNNPDIKITLVKEKTFRSENEEAKILEIYKKVNKLVGEMRTHLSSCTANIKDSLNNAGMKISPKKYESDFVFSKEDVDMINNLSIRTIAYAERRKDSERYNLGVNPLEDFLKVVKKREICDVISHELAGHILVLGLKTPAPIKIREYSTPKGLLENFHYFNLNIDGNNRRNKADDNAGYVSWYANYPKFLNKKFHRMLELQKTILADLEKDKSMDEIFPILNRYGRKKFITIVGIEGLRCLGDYGQFRGDLARTVIGISDKSMDTLTRGIEFSEHPVEDIAETAALMIRPGDYFLLKKDNGTMKKAHMLRRFYIENYGAQNVNLDLPFEEPEEYEPIILKRDINRAF